MSEPFHVVDACELWISIKGFSGKQQVGLVGGIPMFCLNLLLDDIQLVESIGQCSRAENSGKEHIPGPSDTC